MKHPFQILSIFCCLCLLAFLTSCGDIQQELKINKDGSGILETSIEMGELMGIARGMEDANTFQDTFSDDMIVIDTVVTPGEKTKDAMQALMDKITDPKHPVDFDTLISFTSIMPDSVKAELKKPGLAENLFIHLTSPANSSEMKLGVMMKFANSKQLKEIITEMNDLYKDSEMMDQSPMPMSSDMFMVFDMDMSAGIIRVDSTAYKGLADQLGMGADSIPGEELAMVEMMFGASKLKSVIHVPGEVLSCSDPKAILTKDNRVIIEHSMMDVIRTGKLNGYTISFKP